MECHQSIAHGPHSDDCEYSRAYETRVIVGEVEEADREGAEDDGEVEPGEEGTFVGEEDFGFNAGGEGDAFPWFDLYQKLVLTF